uniref:Uncharacterized protein n=1 Tax=Plectus sambesii TaxID=2011161 RepID=A0A914WLQ4_9BILA
MIKEFSNSSANSEEKENCINPDEKLLNDNRKNCNARIQVGFDYKPIGEKLEIEPNALTIIQAIGNGYFSDVHMGMLSLPTGNVPVAVKRPQMETGAMNAAESAAILERQIQALKEEL